LALPFKLCILIHVVLFFSFFFIQIFFFHFKMSNNPIYVVVFLCVWMCDSSWSTYGINIFLHLPFASVVDVNKIFLLLCKPKVVLFWNISYLDVHPSLGFTCLKHFNKQHITLCWKLFHGISYQLTISFKLPCLPCTNFNNGCFINNFC
jgi:hypothetical protein